MRKLPILVGESDPVLAEMRSRRGLTLIALGALLGLGLGTAVLVTAPKNIEATVVLELTTAAPQVNISSVGARPDAVTIDTDAQIVTSDAVVNEVAQATGDDTSVVRANLAVSARPLTQVMIIQYTTDTASGAVDGATSAAQSFLAEREQLIVTPVRNYLEAIVSQDALASAEGRPISQPADDIWALEARRQAALVSQMGVQGAGEIVESARITATSNRADAPVPVVTGAGVGALLGLALSMSWTALRRRNRADTSPSS